ncbi:MAG: hypothetical protein P8X90_12700 [Desulfobacterales bacterium]
MSTDLNWKKVAYGSGPMECPKILSRNLESGELISSIDPPDDMTYKSVKHLMLSPDGRSLAVGYTEKMRIYEVSTDRLLSDFTNKSIDGELVGGMVLYDREGRHLNTSKFNDLYDLRVKSLRAFKRPFLTVRPEMACACFELFDKSQYA